MSMHKALILFTALIIAGMTAFVTRTMIQSPSTTAPVEAEAPVTFEILVAAKDLPSGTLLSDADMKWQVWPKEGSAGFAVKGEKDKKEFVGNVVRYGMRAGEPLTENRTVKAGEQGFMAAALSPGMRAVSIAITPVAGVAGFIFPGDRVDVIVTHLIGRKSDIDPTERRVSETMLKNVRVLALDQKMSDEVSTPTIAQIATLEVTPKQAETLALISQLGTVSLALRSIATDPDKAAGAPGAGPVDPETITWDSDVSFVLPRPANRSGAVQRILVIRGKEVSESLFDLQQQ